MVFCLCFSGSKRVFISNKVPLILFSCSLVYGMVPFLNAILGTMLPMLSLAKQDNMKWVFSSGTNLFLPPFRKHLFLYLVNFLFTVILEYKLLDKHG